MPPYSGKAWQAWRKSQWVMLMCPWKRVHSSPFDLWSRYFYLYMLDQIFCTVCFWSTFSCGAKYIANLTKAALWFYLNLMIAAWHQISFFITQKIVCHWARYGILGEKDCIHLDVCRNICHRLISCSVSSDCEKVVGHGEASERAYENESLPLV